MREPDVDAMLARLPAGTVDRWMKYYELEPWGDDWERTSMLISTMVNTLVSMAPRGENEPAPERIPWDAFVPGRDNDSGKSDLEQAADGLEGLRF